MLQRIIMVLVFLGILFFVHYISFYRLLGRPTWIFASIATLIIPLLMFLEESFSSAFTSWLYRVGTGWFEAIFLLLCIVLIGEVLRYFSVPYVTVGVFSLWAVLIIIGILQAHTWQVTEITLSSDKITETLTIVQLTDIHAYGKNTNKWVGGVIARAEELNPDVIVLTGDVLDRPAVPPDNALAITSDVPLLYTLGNHEFYVGEEIAAQRVKAGDLQLLRQDAVLIKEINFIGIDDADDTRQVSKYIDPLVNTSQFNVLLYHRPSGVEDAASAGVDLMLAGHTHGGQSFPFHPLVRLIFGKYYKGQHQVQNMTLYTSKGSGTYNWPIRLFSSQEIVKITVLPQ